MILQVLKALTILDSGRRIRREEKRLAELRQRAKSAGAKGKSRIGRKSVEIKKNIQNLNAMKPGKGSVSGSLARKVRLWTRTLVKEKLEFYALHLPTETWTQLADMCHLHPENVRSPFHSSWVCVHLWVPFLPSRISQPFRGFCGTAMIKGPPQRGR